MMTAAYELTIPRSHRTPRITMMVHSIHCLLGHTESIWASTVGVASGVPRGPLEALEPLRVHQVVAGKEPDVKLASSHKKRAPGKRPPGLPASWTIFAVRGSEPSWW